MLWLFKILLSQSIAFISVGGALTLNIYVVRVSSSKTAQTTSVVAGSDVIQTCFNRPFFARELLTYAIGCFGISPSCGAAPNSATQFLPKRHVVVTTNHPGSRVCD